jgi:predicted peroxiredoxin
MTKKMKAMGFRIYLFFVPDILRLALKKLKKRQNLVHFWGQNAQKRVLFSTF